MFRVLTGIHFVKINSGKYQVLSQIPCRHNTLNSCEHESLMRQRTAHFSGRISFINALVPLFTKFFAAARSSHQRCSIKKGVLRNFTKFTGKHLCQSLFFNKVADLRTLLVNAAIWDTFILVT